MNPRVEPAARLFSLLTPLACGSPASGDVTMASDSGGIASAAGDVAESTTSADATSGLGPGTGDDSTGAAVTKLDVSAMPDFGAPPGDCEPCTIHLDTQQSGNFEPATGNDYLAELYIGTDRVFAIDASVGNGRAVLNADSNSIYLEGDCPLWQWLGATGDELPRVISFGAGPNCFSFGSNGLHDYPADRFFEAGATLPPEYSADPELLAEDFDVVLYCAGWSQQSTFEAQDADAVQAFVTQHGGGLYLASEYWGPALCPMDNPYPCGATGGIYQEQLDMINSISVALGTTFGMGFVNWAATEGTAEVGIECFPTPAG